MLVRNEGIDQQKLCPYTLSFPCAQLYNTETTIVYYPVEFNSLKIYDKNQETSATQFPLRIHYRFYKLIVHKRDLSLFDNLQASSEKIRLS